MRYTMILIALGLVAGCASQQGMDACAKKAITDFVLDDFPTEDQAEGNEPTRDMVQIDEIRPIRGHKNLYGVRLRYFDFQGYAQLVWYDGRDVSLYCLINPLQGAFVESLGSVKVPQWPKPLVIATIRIRSSLYWNLYEVRKDSLRPLMSCRVEPALRSQSALRSGVLGVEYKDINADGHTDVVLGGVMEIAPQWKAEKVVPWQRVYLYDPNKMSYWESPQYRKGVKGEPQEFRDT